MRTHTRVHRKPDYIAGAFKKTGLLPFTRRAHLEVNRADVQLGDALVAAEKMMERERKRESQLAEQPEVDSATTTTLPMTLRSITSISEMYGAADAKPDDADTYGLKMWPQYEATRHKPLVWRRCLELSPSLKTRFDATDRVELLKFFNVGLLLDEDKENLTTSQALILGYVYARVRG